MGACCLGVLKCLRQFFFLPASLIQDGPRQYAEAADTVAIVSAVSALVNVTLGRRLLVWGGHPAITPMIWVVAEKLGVDYSAWVRLYQSRHFVDQFPEENNRFRNVTYTSDMEGDRERSLLAMRERMLSDHSFFAAVFIGGMEGILQECHLFRRLQPNARVLPVVSTGGATREVARLLPEVHPDLERNLDYLGLFHRHLAVPTNERRYVRPGEQPASPENRLWQPPKGNP